MSACSVALYVLDGQWRLALQGTLTIEYIGSHRSLYLVIRTDTGGSTHPIVNVQFVEQEGSICWDDVGLQRRVALSFPNPQDRQSTLSAIADAQAIAATLQADQEALAFWYTWFLTKPFVPWDAFFRALSALLQKDLTPFAADLQYALGMDSKVTTVSPQQLAVFLAWFGPLNSCLENMRSGLARLSAVIAIQWFHGFITRNESVARLTNQPPGTFLVRFSSNRGCYALSYVDGKGVAVHTLVHTEASGHLSIRTTTGEALLFTDLIDLVQKESRNLVIPCLKPGARTVPDDSFVENFNSLSITERAAAVEAVTTAYITNVASSSTQRPAAGAVSAEHSAAVEELAKLIPALFQIDPAQIELDRSHPLGEGTFAVVYRGKWNEQAVAVKVLKCQAMTAENKQQFRNEVELMSELSHPNIVQWYGVCVDPTMLAIVTEFMDRGSLHSILHKKEGGKYVYPLEWSQRVSFALDTARGMEYLASRNIIHRDLKSLNLLVGGADWSCKVCDFGLSRVKAQQTAMTGEIGTTLWMAPELFTGKKAVYSGKVDVYSFGIIMWELLTREEPYSDLDSHVAVAVQVAFKGKRPPVKDDMGHPEYVALMKRCWAQKADDRPEFSEVVAELERIKAAGL